MAVLWLRFLTEIDEQTKEVPQELLDNPETSKALKTVEESAMSKDELLAYEDFWDKLGAERLLFVDSNRRSMEEGREEGRKEGREEGRKEGREEGRKEGVKEGRADVARNLLSIGMTLEDIAKVTGLEIQDIEQLNN